MSAAEPENILTRYEYYLLGRVPVRIAYNQEDSPFMAEAPARGRQGGLVVDNSYILEILIGAPDDLEEITEEHFKELLRPFQK